MKNLWYCRNCKTKRESWADEGKLWYEKDYEYRRDKKCWSCNEAKLEYTKEQKELYKELAKERTSIPGTVKEVKRFSTWWSNNIATAVTNRESRYWVFLLVYVKEDDSVRMFPTIRDCNVNHWGNNYEGSRKGHKCFSDAKKEAHWLKKKLTSKYGNDYYNNPILLIHPYCNQSNPFNTFISEPYVKEEEIGNSSSVTIVPIFLKMVSWDMPANLDELFKTGDVIKVKKFNNIISKHYFHVGVYLGNKAICHISDPTGLISEENLKVRITDWDSFLRGWLGTRVNGGVGELKRCRPIIPFKYYKKSIEQAMKASYDNYGLGKYDLFNDNCEHFSNAIVFGVYYSQQVTANNVLGSGLNVLAKVGDVVWTKNHNFFWKIFQPSHWGTIGRDTPVLRLFESKLYKVNNGKGKNINLANEIKSWDSNGRFDDLVSRSKIGTQVYEKQYIVQVTPKQECRIM